MEQFDVVMVKRDILEANLLKWQVGTILEDYKDGHFEVELSDRDGITTFLGALSSANLELIWSNKTSEYVGRFKQLLDIFYEIKEYIHSPNTDLIWTKYESIDEVIGEIDSLVDDFKRGTVGTIDRVELLFAPTGVFQEISIRSGWSDKFLEISDRIDELIS